jgi:ubiquinone/menaquinone biosynthesis C-methylase UbiE
VEQSNTQTNLRSEVGEITAFVCPDCRVPLEELRCKQCQATYSLADGIPVLLSRNEKFQAATKISNQYDDIYERHSDVWNNQGRTPEFIRYFAELLKSLSTGKVLEIGCGEGYLLSAVNASEKAAVDISAEALRKARSRTKAQFAVALAERLPFPDNAFDMVFSVGVMEHFLNDREAASEIFRVLRSGGHCAMLLHVDLSSRQRLALKFKEYVFPNFRPLALARWISGKVTSPIVQPIQRRYTVESARECLEAGGLKVYKIISKASDAQAELSGPHVTIFLAQKAAVLQQ